MAVYLRLAKRLGAFDALSEARAIPVLGIYGRAPAASSARPICTFEANENIINYNAILLLYL